jgi:glycosyltransferase involved in cell wall biosynthesis
MTSVAFAVPGDITLATGGYAYDRKVMALLPDLGIAVQHVQLPGGYPNPSAQDIEETGRLLQGLPEQTVILADGLAYGAMPAALSASIKNSIVALVHHPLCLEAGLTRARQDELYALERAALALAHRVVVTSATTAATLTADFAVPTGKIAVAEPGTERAPRAAGTGKPLQLLAVGSIVPRKAYDALVRALAPLADRDWRLAIVGPTDRSAEGLAALQTAIAETGLGARIATVGPVDTERLEKFYQAADVFVMSSLYEGYGMVLAEAMARGLPIVCTTGGAAAQTVPEGAAIKVAPGDVRALSDGVSRLLDDAVLRRRMSDTAWAAGQVLPPWEETARAIAGAIRTVAA